MECYITYCVKGYLAFNGENELIAEKLFPEDETLNRLADLDEKKIVGNGGGLVLEHAIIFWCGTRQCAG